MVNSKAKGKAGELEAAKFLKKHGFEARRGQQFKGTTDSPDVVHSIPGVHLEVKRVEAFRLYDALEQAEQERSNEQVPVVMHRKNRAEWVVIMYAEDWLDWMKELQLHKDNN